MEKKSCIVSAGILSSQLIGSPAPVVGIFFKAKTRNFITSKVDREGHEPPKKL
jgi:hypothetical protein